MATWLILLALALSDAPFERHASIRRAFISNLVLLETPLCEAPVAAACLSESLRVCMSVFGLEPEEVRMHFADILDRCGSLSHARVSKLLAARFVACARNEHEKRPCLHAPAAVAARPRDPAPQAEDVQGHL